jgi:hypothetical protein
MRGAGRSGREDGGGLRRHPEEETHMRNRGVAAFLAITALISAACSGAGAPTAAPATSAAVSTPAATATAAATSAAATSAPATAPATAAASPSASATTAGSPSASATTALASASASVAPSASASASGSAAPSATISAECTKPALTTLAAGKLTVGADNPAYPPYYQIDDPAVAPWELGNPTNGKGLESATAYAVAERLGFAQADVTWVPVPFNNAIQPGTKAFDMYLTQVSYSPERAEASISARATST